MEPRNPIQSVGFVFFWLGDDAAWGLRQRALMAAVRAIAVFMTIAVALYAFLAPIGSRQITFQGRYLVPVLLLLLLSAYGSRIVQRRHRGAPFLAGALVLILVLDLGTIVSSYDL